MTAAAATRSRFVPALGALLAGTSVALSAYAAHAGAPGLASAAWLGLIHGAACAALAPDATDRLSRFAPAASRRSTSSVLRARPLPQAAC